MRSVRRLSALSFASLVAASSLLATTGVAHAESTDDGRRTWAVAPASKDGPDGRGLLEYVVEPGTTVRDHVAVRNFGDTELTVDVYAQDATMSGGSFDLLAPDESAIGVGAWVTLAAEEVVVPPRESVVVAFELEIPSDAEPGDHAGGVVAVAAAAGDGLAAQYRVGTRIYLRVGGPVSPSLAVGPVAGTFTAPLAPFSAGALDIDATIVNTGNIRLTPMARVQVASLFDLWQTEIDVEESPEILPDAAVTIAAMLDGVPPLGPLWVTVDVPGAASAGQDVTASTLVTSTTVVVWAVPWVLVAAIAALLAAAVIAVVNLRRRRAARRAHEAPADIAA